MQDVSHRQLTIGFGRTALAICDTLIWFTFLALLIWASFINDQISSVAWLIFSACVYALLGVHLLSACLGGRCNLIGLRHAIPTIIVLLGILLLLWLQTVLPMLNYLHEQISDSRYLAGYTPDWFKPTLRWSVVPHLTQWLIRTEALMLAIFLLTIGLVCSRRRLYYLLGALMLLALIHSLIAIIAKSVGISLVDSAQLDGNYSAARAWFVNRNHFASFIGLTASGALALQIKYLLNYRDHGLLNLLFDQMLTRKAFVLFALLCAFVAILLSQSRAGVFAPMLAIFICVLAIGKQANRFGQRRKLLVPACVFVGICLTYFGGELITRIANDAFSLGERGAQWALTWSAIKHAWLTGYGGNSYATVFQAARETGDFRQVLFNQAHNDYLHLWLEQGLIGLLLWLSAILLVLRRAYQVFLSSRSTLIASVALAAAIALLAAILQAGVDFNLQILNIRLYFFVIMAMVFAAPTIQQCKSGSVSKFLC